MKLSQKVTIGLMSLVSVLLLSSIIAFYSTASLSGLLNFITTTAWDTADGAMEGSIGIEAQMLAVERLTSGQPEGAKQLLSEGEEMADEALNRMINAGLMSAGEVSELNENWSAFNDQKAGYLASYRQYTEAKALLDSVQADFQTIMVEAEELGDGQVEELENNPNRRYSWSSGLSEKWSAADGAMEAQIHFLGTAYYYQRFIASGADATEKENIHNSLNSLSELVDEISSLRVFQRNQIPNGTYKGKSYTPVLNEQLALLKSRISRATNDYEAYLFERSEYKTASDKLLETIEAIEETADGKVEGEAATVSFTQNLAYTLCTLALIAGLLIAYFGRQIFTRNVVKPIEDLTDNMKLAAKGKKTQENSLHSRNDEIGEIAQALRVFIALFDDNRNISEQATRVTAALQVANTNLMMADNDFNIIYLNDAVKGMFTAAESDLKKDLPDFSASSLEGKNIDIFHKKPSHQRHLLSSLNSSYEGAAIVGGRTFRIVANPVYNDQKERIGTVVEWFDETEMLANQEKERAEAAENTRLKQALDNVSANVMVADADRNIVYMNDAVVETLRVAEEDIKQVLPQFNVEQLLGNSIDIFHKDPSHQQHLLENLHGQHKANIQVGRRHMELSVNPVTTNDGNRVGTVVEWKDNTDALLQREAELRLANENARLKEALENVSANVMVADAERNIVYMNPAVIKTLKNAESAIQTELPNFDTSRLLGESIDQFHKNPKHQESILSKLKQEHNASIEVGGCFMDLCVNPISNSTGDRIGTVVEWFDRTSEVLIQKELDHIVSAASAGNLSQRIGLEGKEGFFAQLSLGLNDILSNTDSFVSDLNQLFEGMAEGNLSQSLTASYQGDFESIANNANATLSKLCSVLSEVAGISNSVNSSANEISQGSVDLSNRTESQASSLEETAASMEEITSTVKESEKNSGEANQEASEARTRAESGGQVVMQAVDAMKEISDSSNKINDIIGVIDEIAFQTNLLALNAAVEAARAGEHGRGFAVVAGEVRTLSQRSASAAKEIKDLIRDSVNKVDSGSTLVNQTGETLAGIVHGVETVARRIDSINVAAKEQSNGIGQINQAISQMDEMTQQNAALVEETAAAARSMSEQANKMQQLVGFFRT